MYFLIVAKNLEIGLDYSLTRGLFLLLSRA